MHVWRVRLDLPDGQLARLAGALSEDERERAARFYFDRHRRRFVVARGALRAILARYLDAPVGALRFEYGAQGKPALARRSGAPDLRFNLAHSGDVALVAVTLSREVGVDIERVRATTDWLGIAERFFSAGESAALGALSASDLPRVFLILWTCKEAYLKGRGKGLSVPLREVEVSRPGAKASPELHVPADPEEAARWSLRLLDGGPEHVAAVAVEGRSLQIRRWDWPGLDA